MFIEKLVVGEMGANSYIVADEDSGGALVIDPGGSAEKILTVLENHGLNLRYVVNTHGHIDHIAANKKILTETGAQLLIHKADANFLKNDELNLSSLIGAQDMTFGAADKTLESGVEIECGTVKLEVLHTPGHTKGSICLLGVDVLFSGDTLFSSGVGRTDLPTGSRERLNKSLAKLKELNDDLTVYPGHGPAATLGEIKENNPYI
ncbi:MAG: MBL fold metallo-hydrolase [Halanaerobacter sp.]